MERFEIISNTIMTGSAPGLNVGDRCDDRAVRPQVSVYNEVSIDGRVTGFSGDAERYYRRGFRWPCDAILMGSQTAQAFGPAERSLEQEQPLPPLETVEVPAGFEQLIRYPRPLLVVPDSRGRVRNWRHARAQPWYGGLIALVAEQTPTSYLDYLSRRNVDYHTAGVDCVDLASSLEWLASEHDVRTVRTDGGGALTGALLAGGLVDRVAVILVPAIAGTPDARPLVQLQEVLAAPPRLSLVEAEMLDDGALSLLYEVKHL